MIEGLLAALLLLAAFVVHDGRRARRRMRQRIERRMDRLLRHALRRIRNRSGGLTHGLFNIGVSARNAAEAMQNLKRAFALVHQIKHNEHEAETARAHRRAHRR